MNYLKNPIFIQWLFDNYNDELLVDHELEKQFCEFLDEVYEPVNICGYEYSQGESLAAVDPIAFRCALADWSSQELTEIFNPGNPGNWLYLRTERFDELCLEWDEYQEQIGEGREK